MVYSDLLDFSWFQSFIMYQTHLYTTWLKIHTEVCPSGQILHAFSDHRDFILLVRTVAIKINSSYRELLSSGARDNSHLTEPTTTYIQ